MSRWQNFLDSLGSKGGQLFILVILFAALMGLVIWITARDAGDTEATTVVISTFSAFSGALLGYLTGTSHSQQKQDIPPQEPPKP